MEVIHMAIQITLSANEFNHSGTYNDKQYTSLQVNYTSKGRIYFTTIHNGMRLSTMAKQIKMENGQALVSFGKNDKLIVGTYTDDSIQEEVAEVIEEQPAEEERVVTFNCSKSLHGFGQSVWINDNRNNSSTMTYYNPKGNQSISIHVSPCDYNKYWEVENFIFSIMKEHGHSDTFWTILIDQLINKYLQPKQSPVNPTKQPTPATNKPDQITESFPQSNMIADYGKILYKGKEAHILFTNEDNETNTVIFKYRKSWSARKYIDNAFDKTGIKPSWQFKYGWEYTS